MVTECNLVVSVGDGKIVQFRAPLRGAPVAVHLFAFLQPLLNVYFKHFKIHVPFAKERDDVLLKSS